MRVVVGCRIQRASGAQVLHQGLAVLVGCVHDEAVAVHGREVAAARGPVVVGHHHETHRVIQRLALELQVDDAPRLRRHQLAVGRVARRSADIDLVAARSLSDLGRR